jgi:hypothetical protein
LVLLAEAEWGAIAKKISEALKSWSEDMCSIAPAEVFQEILR